MLQDQVILRFDNAVDYYRKSFRFRAQFIKINKMAVIDLQWKVYTW